MLLESKSPINLLKNLVTTKLDLITEAIYEHSTIQDGEMLSWAKLNSSEASNTNIDTKSTKPFTDFIVKLQHVSYAALIAFINAVESCLKNCLSWIQSLRLNLISSKNPMQLTVEERLKYTTPIRARMIVEVKAIEQNIITTMFAGTNKKVLFRACGG